jgi:hypothetical protein
MTDVEKTIYILHSTVVEVREHFKTIYIEGISKDAIFKNQSFGWYVLFEGSGECLYFGESQPDLNKGDKVKITFERIIDAQSR